MGESPTRIVEVTKQQNAFDAIQVSKSIDKEIGEELQKLRAHRDEALASEREAQAQLDIIKDVASSEWHRAKAKVTFFAEEVERVNKKLKSATLEHSISDDALQDATKKFLDERH